MKTLSSFIKIEMKKGFVYSLTLVLLLSFTSCQFVFRKAIGLKKEKYTSPQRIEKFAAKYGIAPEHSFQIDAERYWKDIKHLENTDPDLLNDYLQPMQIRLYNEEQLNYGYLYSCNVPAKGMFNLDWQKTGIFDVYPPGIGDKPLGNNLTYLQQPKNPVRLSHDLSYVLDLNNSPVDTLQSNQSNYVMLIYWSITGGRQSQNLIDLARRYAQEHQAQSFSLRYINIDNLYVIEE